jgi:nucleolin
MENNEEIDNINKTIFISGLPYTTTEDEIRAFFEGCGGIKEMKIPKYQDTGRNIGYGHITFKKKKAVEKVNPIYIGS